MNRRTKRDKRRKERDAKQQAARRARAYLTGMAVHVLVEGPCPDAGSRTGQPCPSCGQPEVRVHSCADCGDQWLRCCSCCHLPSAEESERILQELALVQGSACRTKDRGDFLDDVQRLGVGGGTEDLRSKA